MLGINLPHSSGVTVSGKHRATRSLPIGGFVSPLQSCVSVSSYSSGAASLFSGLCPGVGLHVANQQKMTACDLGRTFHIQCLCTVVAVLLFSHFRNISEQHVSVYWGCEWQHCFPCKHTLKRQRINMTWWKVSPIRQQCYGNDNNSSI